MIEHNWVSISTRLTVAKALRVARDKAGLTLREVAAQAGISYSHVYRIEEGLRGLPNLRTLDAVSKAVGLDPLAVRAEAILDGLDKDQAARLGAYIQEASR